MCTCVRGVEIVQGQYWGPASLPGAWAPGLLVSQVQWALSTQPRLHVLGSFSMEPETELQAGMEISPSPREQE